MRRSPQILRWLIPPFVVAMTPAAAPGDVEIDPEAVYEQGKELFDRYASDEIKRNIEFPRRADWDEFLARFQQALEGDDLAALAAYEQQARALLAALRMVPGYSDYTDWLEERVDYVEAARQAPSVQPPGRPAGSIPHYDLWLARVKARPPPTRAAALVPRLQRIFQAEGLPAGLVWVAEAESTFNPAAVSPTGAKGLFQLMPATAKDLGLKTWLPDERGDPEKNARASARYLKRLHARFHDWPLALAAYNAGPGRVQRLLAGRKAGTYGEIASGLPVETRMYVPKVLALVAVRAGMPPERLPSPAN